MNNIKKLKKAFNLSPKYFEDIISFMPGHVYWKDKNGVFLGCNKQQAIDAGFQSPHEMLGKTDYEMPWKGQADYLVNIDRQVMQSGEISNLEELFELPDGTKKIYLSKKLPLYDESHQVSGILGISFDITDRKDMEITLSNALAEAVKSKNIFMSIVSHEIKGPFANVIYILDMIKNWIQGDLINKKEALSLINQEIEDVYRGIKTVDNLLEFLDFELSPEEVADKDKVNIRSELLKLIDKLESNNEKNIGFNISDKDVPTSVKINRHIFKAIQVAIQNAVKFSKKNAEVNIIISHNVLNEKKFLIFSVEDAGVGINKEILARLFSPLFSGEESVERAYFRAPAIRLSYARKISEMLGGKLRVESQEGEWTRVIIETPYELSEHVNPSVPVVEHYEKDNSKVSDRKLNILIVEDNPLTSDLLRKEVRQLKHNADAAFNAFDAQMLAKQKKYDVIFMDISLPGIDGVELSKKLKKITDDKPIIIAITSHDSGKDVEYFLDQGFVAVIGKPFTRYDIVDCIDTIKRVLDDLDG